MSPQQFEKCQMEGGKIRTMPVKGGRHMPICIDKMGKTHAGEVKSKKEVSKK